MTLTIRPIGDAAPIQFAAAELRRYLERICPDASCAVEPAERYVAGDEAALWLGTFDVLAAGGAQGPWPRSPTLPWTTP